MSGGAAPVDTLTEEEREKVRYHLGYIATSSAPAFQLGIPRPVQTLFLLEQAFALLTNGFAVTRVRCILDTLDGLECKLRASVDMLGVAQVGNVRLHPLAGAGKLANDSVEVEYGRWARRLADLLGVPLYPYADRFRRRGPGTNVKVRG